MEHEKGNFRGRLFGGFNRHDVINYIETLAKERGELAKENQKLRERIWELEEQTDAEATAKQSDGIPYEGPRVRVTRSKRGSTHIRVEKRRKRCRRYSI